MKISEEANQALNHLYSVYQGYRYRVTRKAAKELLLYCDGKYSYRGHLLPIQVKNVGLGVYEVWL